MSHPPDPNLEPAALLRLWRDGTLADTAALRPLLERLHRDYCIERADARRWRLPGAPRAAAEARASLERRLDRLLPAWRTLIAEAAAGGLDPGRPEELRALQRAALLARTLPVALPARLNQRVQQALWGAHSKQARDELHRVPPSADGVLRLRCAPGLELCLGGTPLGTGERTAREGEIVLAERALDAGLGWDAPGPAGLITVENLGAYVELPLPQRWAVLWVPGHDQALALRHLPALAGGRGWLHFGDLDGAGLAIGERLAAALGRAPAPFIPEWWGEYLEAGFGLTPAAAAAPWPEAPSGERHPLLATLAERGLWLEQEAILLDRRLPASLAAACAAAG
ncbi:hypothetical protein EV699_104102 [Plasticicumulans lactativorans]|uniref:Wadjet protein JetD C-terminal domain-containing protein n=1 Tax=Plasticicumulans lactativorans TaxID=1133106 RepID=A0A4R2LB46_9GAMM|nr:hypothetical protein [Plasticicumulans lactativorans]TCO82710.1 hypothetical protein EV699_104102 [Plasticicumulans lactativorans]